MPSRSLPEESHSGRLGPSAGKVTLPRASHGCALQHRTGLHTRVATVVNPFIPACLCRSTPGARPEPPNGAILRVPTDVTAMQVTTSDGVIQTVQIVRHPVHQNALVGALVYPPDTQITTMTVADATGPYEVATTQPPSVTSAAQPPVNRLPDLPQMARSSSNTVQLGSQDDVGWGDSGLRPAGVVGAFDVPLGHLAFDDAGGGPRASGGVEPAEQPLEEVKPAGAVAAVWVRGEKRPGGRWSDG